MTDELAEFWVHATRLHRTIDVYGNPSPDGAVLYGFQSVTNRLVTTSDGTETVSGARVSYPPGVAVTLGDHITLDGETTPRRVISISRPTSKHLQLPDRTVVNLQ